MAVVYSSYISPAAAEHKEAKQPPMPPHDPSYDALLPRPSTSSIGTGQSGGRIEVVPARSCCRSHAGGLQDGLGIQQANNFPAISEEWSSDAEISPWRKAPVREQYQAPGLALLLGCDLQGAFLKVFWDLTSKASCMFLTELYRIQLTSC
ncbi:hypothetical protein EJB05_48871, partial [Eragrostis curvula]